MTRVTATVRGGQIVLDHPLALPDGAEVSIEPISSMDDQFPRGMTEEEQGQSPEAIARWIAAFNAIPALVLTAEEREIFDRGRREDKEWELAHADEWAEQLRRRSE